MPTLRRLLLTALLVALPLALPVTRAASPAAPSRIMREGRVLAVGQARFTLAIPALGVYCRPGAACPQLWRAAQDYTVVLTGSTLIAGAYANPLPATALAHGQSVVVYGALEAQASGTTGTILAQAVFILPQSPTAPALALEGPRPSARR